MRKNKIIKIGVCTLAVCIFGGIYINKGREKEIEAKEEKLTSVQVESLKDSTVKKKVKYAGRLSYGQEENLISMVDEKVTYVGVKEGDKVKKGDILVKFDSSKIDENLEKTKKEYEKALEKSKENTGRIEGLKNSLESEKTNIENLKNEKIIIEKEIESLNIELKELEKMKNNGEISNEEYTKIALEKEKALKEKNIKLASIIKDLKIKELEVETLDKSLEGLSKLNIGSMGLESSKKMYEQMLAMKENYILRAPIDGVVLSLNCYINEKIENKMMPAITIGNKENLLFKFGVDETEIKKFNISEKVEMEIEKDNKKIKEVGYIDKIDKKKDVRTGQYKVTVKVKNNNNYDVQAYAIALVENKEKKEEDMISKNALIREENKTFVYIVEEEVVKKKEIKIGKESDHRVKVTSGLDKDDKIIIKGKEYVEENEKVNIVEEDL